MHAHIHAKAYLLHIHIHLYALHNIYMDVLYTNEHKKISFSVSKGKEEKPMNIGFGGAAANA